MRRAVVPVFLALGGIVAWLGLTGRIGLNGARNEFLVDEPTASDEAWCDAVDAWLSFEFSSSEGHIPGPETLAEIEEQEELRKAMIEVAPADIRSDITTPLDAEESSIREPGFQTDSEVAEVEAAGERFRGHVRERCGPEVVALVAGD